MTLQKLARIIIFVLFVSCSSDGESPDPENTNNNENVDNEEGIDNEQDNSMASSEIILSIVENTVIDENDIQVSLPADADVDAVRIYMGSEVVTEITDDPLVFSIDVNSYEDGVYPLKVDVIRNGIVIGSRTFAIKIDNNGPILALDEVSPGQMICGALEISPAISDIVSDIAGVSVYLDDVLLSEFSGTSNYSLLLNPDTQGLGTKNLKFVMQDVVGNESRDSLDLNFGKKLLSISFPQGFIRPNSEKMHVILSDANGGFLGSSTHQSGLAETLDICSVTDIQSDDEFILTFFRDFGDSVFFLYSYQDLTLQSTGTQINLAQRANGESLAYVNIDLPDYQDGYYVRGQGPWSNGFNYATRDIFSGSTYRDFNIPALGSDKMFIMNFHEDIPQSYSYAFVEDPYTVFKLEAGDFSSAGVVDDNLQVFGTSTSPFLSIYGFENSEHFNGLVSHMLYWNSSLSNINNYDYSYADIFDNILHSIKVSNYSVEGLGHPPASVVIPGHTIDYNYSENVLYLLRGVPGYEVGRAMMRNLDEAHIFLEVYFDGQDNSAVVPDIPRHLASSKLTDIIENNRLEMIQCIVEKYATLASYEEYISEVFVPSVPFYTVSPSRERIFKSSVSTSLLPMHEFPFYARF